MSIFGSPDASMSEMKLPREPGTVRPEDPRIRIEALRAAAMAIGATWGGIAQAAIGTEDPSKHITDTKVFDSVLAGAEQFARWLETGER